MMIPSTVPPQIPLQGWEKMWKNVRKCLLPVMQIYIKPWFGIISNKGQIWNH